MTQASRVSPSPLVISEAMQFSESRDNPTIEADDLPIAMGYILRGLPSPLSGQASCQDINAQNAELHALLDVACKQLARDYAQMVLMDGENARLRQQAFAKGNKVKKKETSGHPRHMTSVENLDLLACLDWEGRMKDVFKEAAPAFKGRRKSIETHQKDAVKEVEQARKDCERRIRQVAAEEAKERKRVEKEILQAGKLAEKAAEKARKDAEKAQKDVEKARKAEEQRAAKAAAIKQRRGRPRKCLISNTNDSSPVRDDEMTPTRMRTRNRVQDCSPSLLHSEDQAIARPKPVPRPKPKMICKQRAPAPAETCQEDQIKLPEHVPLVSSHLPTVDVALAPPLPQTPPQALLIPPSPFPIISQSPLSRRARRKAGGIVANETICSGAQDNAAIEQLDLAGWRKSVKNISGLGSIPEIQQAFSDVFSADSTPGTLKASHTKATAQTGEIRRSKRLNRGH